MQYGECAIKATHLPILMVAFPIDSTIPTYWLPIGFLNYLLLHLNPQQDGLENNCRKIEILQADIWQQMISEINQLTFYFNPNVIPCPNAQQKRFFLLIFGTFPLWHYLLHTKSL